MGYVRLYDMLHAPYFASEYPDPPKAYNRNASWAAFRGFGPLFCINIVVVQILTPCFGPWFVGLGFASEQPSSNFDRCHFSGPPCGLVKAGLRRGRCKCLMCIPGPQQNVKSWPHTFYKSPNGHCFTYLWLPGRGIGA